MTREEAAEVLLSQSGWLVCPHEGVPLRPSARLAYDSLRDQPADLCPACNHTGSHGNVENPVYTAACRILGLETPREKLDRIIVALVDEPFFNGWDTTSPEHSSKPDIFPQIREALGVKKT
jgi:hypothetical protein